MSDVSRYCPNCEAQAATIARLEAENARLLGIINNCAQRFREYEASHAAKGSIDGDAKARRNGEMAEMCERAAPNSMPDTHHFGPKSAEPKPSAYGHQEHCNHPGSPCTCEEPKPSAGVDSIEAACEAYWNAGMTVTRWQHESEDQKESVRRRMRAAALFICKGKDADTATMIADNDEKIEELNELKRRLKRALEAIEGH